MMTDTSEAENVSLPPLVGADLNWSRRMLTVEPAGMTRRPSADMTSAPTLACIMAPDWVVRELMVSGTVAEKVVPAASDGAGAAATGLGAGFAVAGFGVAVAPVAGVAAGVAAVSAIGLVESCWASCRSRLRLSAMAASDLSPPPHAAMLRTHRVASTWRMVELLWRRLAGRQDARRN